MLIVSIEYHDRVSAYDLHQVLIKIPEEEAEKLPQLEGFLRTKNPRNEFDLFNYINDFGLEYEKIQPDRSMIAN